MGRLEEQPVMNATKSVRVVIVMAGPARDMVRDTTETALSLRWMLAALAIMNMSSKPIPKIMNGKIACTLGKEKREEVMREEERLSEKRIGYKRRGYKRREEVIRGEAKGEEKRRGLSEERL